jgi:hypothetical protein
MDRQGISSPVFHNNDGANNCITKSSIFKLQRATKASQSRLKERIDNLAIDIRHSEAHTRDYFDNKISAQKEEQRCKDGGNSDLVV